MPHQGHIEEFLLESDALAGNRLGDPATRTVTVYLPAAYEQETSRTFSTIYLLPSHGRTSFYYTSWNQWNETIQDRLDRLIAQGDMPPTIMVIPDCWTRFGGSCYLDSPIGNYRTHLIDEILPAVESRYRIHAEPANRAVCGHSSGGYGAITIGMTQPDVFAAIGARAPDMYWEYSVMPMLARLPQLMEKWGGFAAFIDAIPTIHPKRSDFWIAIHVLMQCMAFAPNPNSLIGFDPPIDTQTGALLPDVWERWLAFDPVRMIDSPQHQDALHSLQQIFLDVGTFDEYHLQTGARIFHQKLLQHNITHHYEEFPDGHSSTSYRFDVMLPILAKAIVS